jgi:membrane protease YdiL (CAAX protease family)
MSERMDPMTERVGEATRSSSEDPEPFELDIAENHEAPGSWVNPALAPALDTEAFRQREVYYADEPARPRARYIPHLGHVLLFLIIAVVMLGAGQVLGVALLEASHLCPHHSFSSLFQLSNEDTRIAIPIQALCYGLIALVVIPVFSLLWQESFREGVQWRAFVARRRFFWLAVIGLAAGFGIGLFGDLLPMPKDPPVMQDMMKSPAGAWMMLVFGLTAAPLLEELAFRGFLLPALLNFFRWLAARETIAERTVRWIGLPVSVLLTSAAFAYMHSPQVSHAWGPLLLIGMVSVVLCIVRLRLDSVAAGVIVHAAYNFTLFAGVLVETGGFRHLNKLLS